MMKSVPTLKQIESHVLTFVLLVLPVKYPLSAFLYSRVHLGILLVNIVNHLSEC